LDEKEKMMSRIINDNEEMSYRLNNLKGAAPTSSQIPHLIENIKDLIDIVDYLSRRILVLERRK